MPEHSDNPNDGTDRADLPDEQYPSGTRTILDDPQNVVEDEIGVEMSRFPSDRHLASWAGVCPGNTQSGGKRLSGKITKGNARLRSVLVESLDRLLLALP